MSTNDYPQEVFEMIHGTCGCWPAIHVATTVSGMLLSFLTVVLLP